ncbi:MAG: NAD-dependent epimerase/dehydratase family protein [Gemmatimonadaceae bacterium]|nr:NAD-dependent epimerase/dehydratase family protein [Gemmatimonadaceae bacterium]
MSAILILGGTRNLGHVTALALLEAGHEVTILNRGQTRDELPRDVERLRADRSDTNQLRAAIGQRSFDLIFDATTYTGADARQAIDVFSGRAGRYVFVSSGQVYLVREGLERPFREADYAGPVMDEPPRDSADHPSWLYGADKRDAEDAFMAARSESGFPVMTLRLPMVASERDHYGRIQGYAARILDGGPLLLPEGEGLPLRHVYVADVARLVVGLAGNDAGSGRDYNISYGSSMKLARFIALLAAAAGRSPDVLTVDRGKLVERGLLPHCSPFSGRWMSELDNTQSLAHLGAAGIRYTAPEDYLPKLLEDFTTRWAVNSMVPEGYSQRREEVAFAGAGIETEEPT